MTHIITRRLEFDAAHRVLGHEGRCRFLHGHRYKADISFTSGLDALGRVIDFGMIKSVIGKWIDDNWDHNILLNIKDPLAAWYLLEDKGSGGDQDILVDEVFDDRKPYIMISNPTAENIASDLWAVSSKLVKANHITITQVRIWETPNCYADFIP